MKRFICLFVFIALLGSVKAAIIHGTVYGLSLEKIDNARVEINTTPRQFMIAQNGSYSFNVPNGHYGIKGNLMEKGELIALAQENITVKHEGSYVLDLILFPDIEEGVEDIGIDFEEDLLENGGKKNGSNVLFFVLLSLIILSIIIYFLRTRKQVKITEYKGEINEINNDLEKIIQIIKNEGGRTTQKDIRKQIPLSEAKISLMIAELEHKGVIEKIKKGRGNIVILKSKNARSNIQTEHKRI
jgi:uncharacterized membrane protein